MEEAYSPRRDRLEDLIAKVLDIRDYLADEARMEDRRARDRTNRARTRRTTPTPIRTDEPDTAA